MRRCHQYSRADLADLRFSCYANGRTLSMDGGWRSAPDYATLRIRLEIAHSAVEAAAVEVRRWVRLNGGRER